MFKYFNFKKKINKNYSKHYMTLVLVIIVIIIAILGLMLFKDALFPLIISGIWAFLIKNIKNTIKNYFV
jgi:predicted PurR-regulated permease PerM